MAWSFLETTQNKGNKRKCQIKVIFEVKDLNLYFRDQVKLAGKKQIERSKVKERVYWNWRRGKEKGG